MLFILGLLTLGYLFFSVWIYSIWRKIKSDPVDISQEETESIDVVICARNEEANVLECLTSLLNQDWPVDRYQIHFFNDQSVDRTEEIARSLQTHQITFYNTASVFGHDFEGSTKKRAIEHICKNSQSELIAVADADCIYTGAWLRRLSNELSPDGSMITGPFSFKNPSSFLDYFQVYEMAAIGLMSEVGTNKGWFSSASASNMMFKREDFIKLDPYSDNIEIASGDDVFLAKAFTKANGKIQFARQKECMVMTHSEDDYQSLLNQKVRWGLKLKVGKPDKAYWIWGLIWVFNFLYLVLGVYSALCLIMFFPFWLVCFATKLILDYIWVSGWCKFYSHSLSLPNFILSGFLYPFYLTHLSFRMSFAREIEWKGRKHPA